MAREDLVPSYLAEIFNRAIPDPLTPNDPFQGFTSPIDAVVVSDSVSGSTTGQGPYLYGVARYAAATYGNHP